MTPLYRFEGEDTPRLLRDRYLNQRAEDLKLDVYDVRCYGCGALYEPPAPEVCQLCGHICFEPVEDLSW